MLLARMFNPKVSLSQRLRQVANAGIEYALGRSLKIAHVVEFPKCGGSWVRNMIRTYRGTELFTYDRLLGSRDVVMVHRTYRSRYRQPIVVVRDPRDLYVSFYHYENSYEKSDGNSVLFKHFQHDKARPLQDDFYLYLRAKLLRESHPWFFYSQFLDSWLNRSGVCVVRYEDCLKEPVPQLVRMLRFLGDEIDIERVEKTVEETSFKAITKKRYGEERDAGHEDNTKFHRKGIAGDWRNHFNADACRLLDLMEGSTLRRLGYEPDASWIDRFVDQIPSNHSSSVAAA